MSRLADEEEPQQDNTLISSERISWDGPSIPRHAFLPNTVRQETIILYDPPVLGTDAANKVYVDGLIATLIARIEALEP